MLRQQAVNSIKNTEKLIKVKVLFIFIVITCFSIAAARKGNTNQNPKQNIGTQRVTRMHKFTNCPLKPNLPYRLIKGIIKNPRKNVYALDGDGVCEKETKAIESISVNITKCSDSKMSQCRRLPNMSWKGAQIICPLLIAQRMPWSSVFKAFSPRLTCTNKKGNFTIRNMIPDSKDLAEMYFEGNGYWIVSFEFLDEKLRPWSCFYSENTFETVHG